MARRPVNIPIVCDMTDAPDTGPERLEEYGRLFATALEGRERTATGVRFRFRDDAATEAWVRDLAAREQSCCGFFAFSVTREPGAVVWDASVADDDIARAILEEFFAMPDTLASGPAAVRDRLAGAGLTVPVGDAP